MKVKQSQRLSFELMTSKDAGLLYELDQDPEVLRYINGGKISTEEDIRNIMIPRMMEYLNKEKGWGLWKVLETHNNEFIGWILIRPVGFFTEDPQYENLEIGWRFHQKSWGKGYATEAAKQIVKEIEGQKKAKKITAIAVEENTASIKIMKKIGMTFTHKGVHKDPLGDMEVVYYEMSLLR